MLLTLASSTTGRRRLLQLLGLETIYPQPKTSTPAPEALVSDRGGIFLAKEARRIYQARAPLTGLAR
jgi:hypothetical protein